MSVGVNKLRINLLHSECNLTQNLITGQKLQSLLRSDYMTIGITKFGILLQHGHY